MVKRQPASATVRERAHRALLKRLGARVQSLRRQLGLTRVLLAERSGVSVRFLAELESGAGNISVARLADVAHALGTSAPALLGAQVDPGPSSREGSPRAAVDALLDGRSEAELREVQAWLASRFAPAQGSVIALLGVRGAGKSTVGKKLAARLDLPFVELDALIEEAAGLSLAEIFELHGEAYYRRLERETLSSLLASARSVVLATGGSLVNDRETFRLLRRRATTVWLKARPEEHMARVLAQGDQRPMARNPHAMQQLEALLVARARRYSEADHTVDTSGRPVRQVVEAVARLVASAAQDGRRGGRRRSA